MNIELMNTELNRSSSEEEWSSEEEGRGGGEGSLYCTDLGCRLDIGGVGLISGV